MIHELPYQKEAKMFIEVSAEGFEINLVKTMLDLLYGKGIFLSSLTPQFGMFGCHQKMWNIHLQGCYGCSHVI